MTIEQLEQILLDINAQQQVSDSNQRPIILLGYALFLEDHRRLALDQITLDTPELRYREFLKTKYRNLDALRTAHCRNYASFNDIAMPQAEADWAHMKANSGALRWEFAARNYLTVLEHIALYGRGIWNTVVYCGLAVLMALLVNPIAAYALSRYRLPSQYKILFF